MENNSNIWKMRCIHQHRYEPPNTKNSVVFFDIGHLSVLYRSRDYILSVSQQTVVHKRLKANIKDFVKGFALLHSLLILISGSDLWCRSNIDSVQLGAKNHPNRHYISFLKSTWTEIFSAIPRMTPPRIQSNFQFLELIHLYETPRSHSVHFHDCTFTIIRFSHQNFNTLELQNESTAPSHYIHYSSCERNWSKKIRK